MPDLEIAEFLSTRLDSMEARFEARFDRLEVKLDRRMEKNGKQNLHIQKNRDRIEALESTAKRRDRRLLVFFAGIVTAMAGAVVSLLKKL